MGPNSCTRDRNCIRIEINFDGKKFSDDVTRYQANRVFVSVLEKAKTSHMLYIFAISIFISPTLCSPFSKHSDVEKLQNGLETFGARLYSNLTEINSEKNIVFSPFSIQTCLAMTRLGAEGTTADEMDQGLVITTLDRKQLANTFHSVLEKYQNSPVLSIANKIYVNQGYEVQDEFNNLLTKQFYSSVDSINFDNSKKAAQTINSWVENKTNHLIKDLIKSYSLDNNTALLLVNALHLKANWVNHFPKYATYETDFHVNEKTKFKVNMMRTTDSFNYGAIPELGATAVEMRYKDSDLSMLIILPNRETNLANVEKKLQGTSLSELTKYMNHHRVELHLPKFKVEFEAELVEPLRNMGIKRMFEYNAEFCKMVKCSPSQSLSVSSVVHKAVIKVDEYSTEASATAALVSHSRIAVYVKEFIVDRPFHYVIKNDMNVVLFKGNIKTKFLSE